MCRNLPQPLHSRILHRYGRIKPLSYSMTNESSTFLTQKVDQSFLLRYQGIDPGCFAVEKCGDSTLFRKNWQTYMKVANKVLRYPLLSRRSIHHRGSNLSE